MSKEKTYYSFDEIAVEEFGMKPMRYQTNDKQKLEAQREKFVGVCPYCKQPASFVANTNVLTCTNPQCKGKKVTFEDGTVTYIPYNKLLSSHSMEIGVHLFEEKEKIDNGKN